MGDAYTVFAGTLFRPCEAGDVARCFELEVAGYPADEAASLEGLTFRQAKAGEFFMVAEEESAVRGFVCGTLSAGSTLEHDTMSDHVPEGRLLCIHSVCVEEAWRRRKLGSRLLSAYLRFVAGVAPHVEEVRLICKEHLVSFYEAGGFAVVGPSPVVHGADSWIEMVQSLAGEEA